MLHCSSREKAAASPFLLARKMASLLSFQKGLLLADPPLRPGEIDLDNRTGDNLTLSDVPGLFTQVLAPGPQKVRIPDVPSLAYQSKLGQGKISVKQEALSLNSVSFEKEVDGRRVPIEIDNGPPGLLALLGLKADIAFLVSQTGVIYTARPREDGPWLLSEAYNVSNYLVPLDSNYEERGLLDLALADDGRWFIFVSLPAPPEKKNLDHVNHVYEVDTKDGTNTLVVSIDCESKIHNGGRLLYYRGYLFVSVGDDGPQEDPKGHAQNLQDLRGKILRFDVSVPRQPKPQASNPFRMNPAEVGPDKPGTAVGRPEIYALGFRNCWGLSVDSKGQIFAADVGYKTTEEVNIIGKGGNFGWPYFEGSRPTPWSTEPRPVQIPPIYEYNHEQARNPKMSAIIGGFPMNDRTGRPGYLFADLAGRLYFIVETQNGWRPSWQTDIPMYIKALGTHNGKYYLLAADGLGPTAKSYVYQIKGL